MLEKPVILLSVPATTALLADTVPSTTLSILLISWADELIAVPPKVIDEVVKFPVAVILLNPLISLFWSTTTALEPLTVPEVTLCNTLSSAALDVTRSPASFNPEDVVLCEAISKISGPFVVPIFVTPVLPCVITLPLVVCPKVMPSNTANESALRVVEPNTRFPPTLRLLVTCWEPFTVKSPLVTITLPLESMLIFSDAAAVPPVINDNVVGLLVELKSPSDLATIEAPTIVATSPVASSGDWNSILPSISLICISVEDDCNFNTDPSSLFDVILLTFVVPEISKLTADAFLVIDTSLNPEISLFDPATTTFPPETTPSTTWSNLLICIALDVTLVPPRIIDEVVTFPVAVILLNPVTSLLPSTVTALPADTTPFVIPARLLISAALAVISSPPRLIADAVNFPVKSIFLNPPTLDSLSAITTFPPDTVPAVTPSNLLISSDMAVISTPLISRVCALSSPVIVILFTPVKSLLASTTNALEAEAVPGKTESINEASADDIVVSPIVSEPSTVTLDPKVESPTALNLPILTSDRLSIVTSPEVSPSSVLVPANTNEPDDSCQISDLLAAFVAAPSPLVNTKPRSWLVPVLPSPNLISLSDTVKLVAWVVTTFPVTVKSPKRLVLPSTVKSLVICWVPLTVRLPPVTLTFPNESILTFSVAAAPDPVKNDNLVELLVELKSPSDLATIEAPTIFATAPVDSSGAENSILPKTSLTCISVEAESNFNTDPPVVLEVKLFTLVVPDTATFPKLAVPDTPTLLNPEILLLASTMTAFPDETCPPVTVLSVFISSAVESIAVPPKVIFWVVIRPARLTSLKPEISLLPSTITALLADTVPLVIPCNILISEAVDVISIPPRLIVPVVNFPDNSTFPYPVIFLLASTTIAFPADTVPGVTLLNLLISSDIAVISTPLISNVWALNSPVIVILFIPLISLLASNTTALWALAVPEVTPLSVLISVAVDLTRTPPNLRPEALESWEAISTTWVPFSSPNLVIPVNPCVTTFPLADWPRVRFSTTASEVSSRVVFPSNKLPSTVKFSVICCDPLTVKSPLVTVTLPLESILILSLAGAPDPVINANFVELLVEL